jgi:transaldolase
MDDLKDSLLARVSAKTPTEFWNDSCDFDELEYAVAHGAVGATANPTIVSNVWRRDPTFWQATVRALAREHATWTEVELAWGVVEAMSTRAAPLLLPAFERTKGRRGRLSVQTDPTLWRTPQAMVAQGARFHTFAPNVIVKFPATAAGIVAIEEATYQGVIVNSTVSFSVAQAVAAAEAIERGLRRREAEGLSTDGMSPVVTIMVGRLEDWLRVLTERDSIIADPGALPWSGVAVFKRAYQIFRERGFRSRVLAAAIRHHLHWSEFVGGDVVITLPSIWQWRLNASTLDGLPRMDRPVDPAIVSHLLAKFPDFVRAYEPGGLPLDKFDTFGPSVRTLRAFIESYHDLLHQVSDALLPNPDLDRS